MPKSPFEKLVSKEVLAAATRRAAELGRSVGWILMQEHGLALDAVGQALEKHYKVPFVPFDSGLRALDDLAGRFPADHLRFQVAVQIGRDGGKPVLLMAEPDNLTIRDELHAAIGTDYAVRVGLREHILCLLEGTTPGDLASPPRTPVVEIEPEDVTPLTDGDEGAIVTLVNVLLLDARKYGVDEIRLDPTKTPGAARRLKERWEDGGIPPSFIAPMIGRLKVMANLDLGNRNKSQKGYLQLALPGGKRLRYDVEIEPLGGGVESARILPSS